MGAAFIFSFVGGFLTDKFGRKVAILISAIIFTAGSITMGVATSKEILLVGRIILGMGIGKHIIVVTIIVNSDDLRYCQHVCSSLHG